MTSMQFRPMPEAVAGWSDAEVALAWWCVRYDIDPADPAPDPDVRQRPMAAELDRLTGDAAFIARWRARLGTVSWFMKALKDPLSRMANCEDNCIGACLAARSSPPTPISEVLRRRLSR